MTDGGSGEKWNFRILLGQGIFDYTGSQLTSEKLVLPFIYTALGGPLLLAGLIVPIVRVTKLVAQITVAPVIHASRQNKWFCAGALLALAVAMAIVCLTVRDASVAWVAVIFVAVTIVLGVSDGITGLAFTDMLGRVLPEQRRSTLLFAESGVAGLVAVLVALWSQTFITSKTPLDAHLELMWIGVVMLLIAAVGIVVVREPAKQEDAPKRRETEHEKIGSYAGLRESFGIAFALPWFRRFVVARTLFLSIELAMPFYAIHAAILHKDKVNGLSTFVIASCVGLIIGGLVWPRVSRRSIRTVLAASAIVACLAGLLALALARWPQLQSPHPYSVVIAMVAFSAQGISNGRTVFLIGATTDANRSYCIAVANVLTGALAIVVAAILGTAAHFRDVHWAIWIMVALNVAAALYAGGLGEAKQPAAHDQDQVKEALASVHRGRG